MSRGRYRRDDYDREGPIHIYISFRHAFGGFLLLVLGTTIRGLTTHYSNASKIREDHQCPALDERIHQWVANLGNLFIVLSVVLFSVGGVVPKLFHVCQLRDNAICCGKIFMTMFGSVIEFVGFVVFVLYNFYGTTLLREGYEKGIQTTEKYPPKLFEVYCDKIIWNTFRVTNYGTYALIGIYILYLIIIAIIKLNRFTKDVKKPTLSFSLREREILDTLGYVYEDETDEQSDEEKKEETRSLLEPNKETKSKVKNDPSKDAEPKAGKDLVKTVKKEGKDNTEVGVRTRPSNKTKSPENDRQNDEEKELNSPTDDDKEHKVKIKKRRDKKRPSAKAKKRNV